jgi:Fe-S cluster assembly protein SufD
LDNTEPVVFTITTSEPQTIRLKESGEYRVEILAEGAQVRIRGGWETRGSENVKILLSIVHKARHTRSETLLRGVAHDRSKIELSGTIVIEKGAQDTNAFLTENILLLSDKAVAHAVPNLEIEANEVKCSHAATVAKIPEEHLFYLQSRGLERSEAQRLIIDGFLGEV